MSGRSTADPRPPLDGVRVLDLTHVLAGPFCTRLLADLGADVLRVESSRHPDAPWRSAVDPTLERDVSYLVVNRNKRSIAVDLKTDAGRDLGLRLASNADVVAENFSAGVMDRLGLGFERLRGLNPRLIFVSMSGYGHGGPRRDWMSMNTNLQAYSGLMMVTGREDDPPTAISNSWMDYVGGLHAAFAVVEALADRGRTGQGRLIDLSQFEAGVATIGPLLLAAAVNGSIPQRMGNRSEHAAPQGCYRCAGEDEWCAVSVRTAGEWGALLEVLGHPAWKDDARFATIADRRKHHDALDEHITAWTRGLPAREVEERLAAAGVPARRMRRIPEVIDAPDRSGVFRSDDTLAGFGTATLLPFTLGPGATVPLARAARLGEHTDEVLASWLGTGSAEIARLRDDGVLV